MEPTISLKVGKIEQYPDFDSGQTLQRVPYEIIETSIVDGEPEEKVLMERHQSFPLTATKDDIIEVLTRSLTVYKENVARYEASKERQANLDHAAQIGEELTGLEIQDL